MILNRLFFLIVLFSSSFAESQNVIETYQGIKSVAAGVLGLGGCQLRIVLEGGIPSKFVVNESPTAEFQFSDFVLIPPLNEFYQMTTATKSGSETLLVRFKKNGQEPAAPYEFEYRKVVGAQRSIYCKSLQYEHSGVSTK